MVFHFIWQLWTSFTYDFTQATPEVFEECFGMWLLDLFPNKLLLNQYFSVEYNTTFKDKINSSVSEM